MLISSVGLIILSYLAAEKEVKSKDLYKLLLTVSYFNVEGNRCLRSFKSHKLTSALATEQANFSNYYG